MKYLVYSTPKTVKRLDKLVGKKSSHKSTKHRPASSWIEKENFNQSYVHIGQSNQEWTK